MTANPDFYEFNRYRPFTAEKDPYIQPTRLDFNCIPESVGPIIGSSNSVEGSKKTTTNIINTHEDTGIKLDGGEK
jgi:hypothetical protein